MSYLLLQLGMLLMEEADPLLLLMLLLLLLLLRSKKNMGINCGAKDIAACATMVKCFERLHPGASTLKFRPVCSNDCDARARRYTNGYNKTLV